MAIVVGSRLTITVCAGRSIHGYESPQLVTTTHHLLVVENLMRITSLLFSRLV